MGIKGIILDTYTDKKKCQLLVVNDDGSRDIYDPSSNGFVKVKSLPAPASATHEHEGMGMLPDIISLLQSGITGSKTVGSYKLTFNHGILTGFEQIGG